MRTFMELVAMMIMLSTGFVGGVTICENANMIQEYYEESEKEYDMFTLDATVEKEMTLTGYTYHIVVHRTLFHDDVDLNWLEVFFAQ